MKKLVNISINQKASVGQSMIASSLMQYFDKNNHPIQGIDLDNTFHTLSKYKSLDVELVDATSSGDCSSMSGNKLNSLVERITVDNKHYVIDCNSLSFSGVMKFFNDSGVMQKLYDGNADILFHIVIQGGPKLTENLQQLSDLIAKYPTIKIIAWLNAYTGDVILANKKFENMNVYIKNKKNFVGIVNIDKLPSYSEPDVKQMLSECLSISDVDQTSFDDSKKAKMKRFTETLMSRVGKELQNLI
jgi:hypothetical protein